MASVPARKENELMWKKPNVSAVAVSQDQRSQWYLGLFGCFVGFALTAGLIATKTRQRKARGFLTQSGLEPSWQTVDEEDELSEILGQLPKGSALARNFKPLYLRFTSVEDDP